MSLRFDAAIPGPYVEGKNFVIEFRGAEGKRDRAPALVADLVQLKVDVLIVPLASGMLAAKQTTNKIPIIMVTQVDPVATGIVDSLAHPGGNITGLATLQRDLSGKRLELLKEPFRRYLASESFRMRTRRCPPLVSKTTRRRRMF